ncbi:hypothetical protein [Pelagibacterium lacus]|uniref:Uncharacterized protein n=1 Tax=Pelagibacterium lacus TaxID=2282655 RepID=A0A369VZJ4_9HYPH|nr:hypothetical protein [Pelagibacterium lacus]RDE07834.1 hypothetical protein DVH29_14600 [Pelagibacterium lacus]
MFETVQIARRHLIGYEYPDARCAVEVSASWSGAILDPLGWFASRPRAEASEGEDEEGGAAAMLSYGWPNY